MLKNSPNFGPFPGKSGKKSPAGTQVRRKTSPFRGVGGGNSPGLRRFREKSVFAPFSFPNLAKNVRELKD